MAVIGFPIDTEKANRLAARAAGEGSYPLAAVEHPIFSEDLAPATDPAALEIDIEGFVGETQPPRFGDMAPSEGAAVAAPIAPVAPLTGDLVTRGKRAAIDRLEMERCSAVYHGAEFRGAALARPVPRYGDAAFHIAQYCLAVGTFAREWLTLLWLDHFGAPSAPSSGEDMLSRPDEAVSRKDAADFRTEADVDAGELELRQDWDDFPPDGGQAA